jgi:hypothetical protein
MTVPLISVCIPAYNAMHALPATLASVQQQTWQELEIVICVDPSTDDTLAFCQSAAAADPRIKVFENHDRHGWAGNTRLTISKSEGEYWCLLPQDDLLQTNYVSALWQCLQDSGADFSYSDKEVFSAGTFTGVQALPDYNLAGARERLMRYYENEAAPSFWLGLCPRRIIETLEFPVEPFNFPALDNLWANRLLLHYRGARVAMPLFSKRSATDDLKNCTWWWAQKESGQQNLDNWALIKAGMIADVTALLGPDQALLEALELAMDIRCYRPALLNGDQRLAKSLYARWRPAKDAPASHHTASRWLMASRCSEALGWKRRAVKEAIRAVATGQAGVKAWQNLVRQHMNRRQVREAGAALLAGLQAFPQEFSLKKLHSDLADRLPDA